MMRLITFTHLVSFFFLLSCHLSQEGPGKAFQNRQWGYLILSSKERITTILASTQQEQVQGLSGLMSEDFSKNSGMLFVYPVEGLRSFWMPDTHFDLDLFFLDRDLKVLEIERRVPHHPSRKEPIPRVRAVRCRHVLEMRADSPLSQSIQVGQKLTWSAKEGPSLL